MKDFILSISDNNQADVIEVIYSTSRYLDGLLNIDIKVRKRQTQRQTRNIKDPQR